MDTYDIRTFFASMNTAKGFFSSFSTVFDPQKFHRIFILKGGPGTGKSSLMKEIAKSAEEAGLTVDRFLCSSDPASYDGVILPEKGIAVLDGTAPHTTDPVFPGIVENIINLGSFWDAKKLSKHKSEIIGIIKNKNRFYKRAYQFLAADGEIASEIAAIARFAIYESKMESHIKRQSEKCFQKGAKGMESVRNTETFCKEGLLKLDSFERQSQKIYILEDHLFSAHLYLSHLYEMAKSSHQTIWKSLSPLFPELPNGLYFPATGYCFVIGERDYDKEIPGKEYHYVNMKRFFDTDKIRQNRQKIRFGQKCMKMLENGAACAFSDAAKEHENLERYYIEAMDFEKLQSVKNEIFRLFTKPL